MRGWVVKASIFFLFGGVISATIPPAVGAAIAGHVPFDLSMLGTLGGALVGLLGATFVRYWIHRGYHRSKRLWQWSHQLHHSAERLDIAGFAYSHPLEIAIGASFAPITSVALGVTPEAAMVAGYVAFVLGLVEHLAVATPRWLGYIITRPEAHSLHHSRGVHAYNYSLPIWDILFGTFRNPERFAEQTGFWDGASRRTFALLAGRDVATPR